MMRETISLNEGWIYHEDDTALYPELKDIVMYRQSKTECLIWGPGSLQYTEGLAWRHVQLPHDYIIDQTPNEANSWALGHFRYHNAWYRRHFALSAQDEGRRIALYFEGIATHAAVYVNGCLAGRSFCGYTPFELDITSFVLFGQDNLIAVYVDSSSSFEGWWYQGGGIYRDAWLIKGEQAHIARDGVFIHPEHQGNEAWRIPIDIDIRNDDVVSRKLLIECESFDSHGTALFKVNTALEIAAYSSQAVHMIAAADHPARWDIASPNLYYLETRIYDGNQLIDSQREHYGFRTFHYDETNRFILNGRPVTIQGVNGHQDYGLTGKVMPDRVARYRAQLFKEMGVNAVRCSHYPHTRCLMDAYDELGFIVMAETRWFSDEPESLRQLETLIRRERNRPSVMFWSIGNEEPTQAEARGPRIAQRLFARVRQLDHTRLLTTVVDRDPINAPVVPYCDVICVNYNLKSYDALHEKYPNKPFVAGELCATGTTRGWYADSMPARGYYSAYDHDTNAYFTAREFTWKYLMQRDWVSGGFQWDAIEHRGEGAWPRLCSVSGAIDLYLQKKDAFYQNKSHWTKEPMLHLLPHWNHTGAEGREIPVWAYTNCEEAELFLNGISLGRTALKPYDHAQWPVPYAPGQLRAVGYRGGVAVCQDMRETTGDAVALKLIVNTAGDKADGRDVAVLTCVCLDACGREVPDAQPLIHFDVSSLGTIWGTGSDNCDHSPVANPDRRMHAGRCSICVRFGKEPGILTISARSAGLASALVDIVLCKTNKLDREG